MRVGLHLIRHFKVTVFYISVSIQLSDPSCFLLSIHMAILLFSQRQHVNGLISVMNLVHWRRTRILLSTSPEARLYSFVDGSYVSAQTSSEFAPILQHFFLKRKRKEIVPWSAELMKLFFFHLGCVLTQPFSYLLGFALLYYQ